MDNETPLLNLCRGKTYAIVGNGPSEVGKKRGREIDGREIVIRMNNFSLNYPQDYGCKVCVWVCTFWCDTVYTYMPEIFKLVVNPLPVTDKRWLAHYPKVNFERMAEYKAFICLPRFHDETWKLMNSPSTGFSFLYWFYREVGSLDANSIFGFSYFDKAVAHHYCDREHKTGNHNGVLEKEYIQKMCEGKL